LKVKVEVTGDIERKLLIELPPEDVRKEFDKAYKRYRRSLQIPGFRKGKVPIELIKARYGDEIKGEVLSDLIPRAYSGALAQEGIKAVSDPEIGDVDYTEGEGLRFTASVAVMPEIGKYEGLKVIKTVYEVTDEDVDAYIERLREENSREVPVERGVQIGDVVIADLRELDTGGVPIIGNEVENEEIIVGGEKSFGPEFDEQLIGAKKGEERVVRFSQEGRTSPMVLSVRIKEVKERRTPELNDDFARDLGNFESVEELREKVRENLQREAERLSRRELRDEVINQLMGENPFDVPEMLVEKVTEDILEDMKRKTSTSYVDEEALRMQARKEAIRDIKSHLIIRSIAEAEGISVSDEELENHISDMARASGMEPAYFRDMIERTGNINGIRSKLLEDKVIDFVLSRSKIEESKARRGASIYVPGSSKKSF